MRTLLYTLALVLIIFWLVGAFLWHLSNLIYILLVLAIIAFALGAIRRGNVNRRGNIK